MADNVTTPYGIIASDEIEVGVQTQILKVIVGLDGQRVYLNGSAAFGLLVDVTRVAKTPLTGSAPTFANVGIASGIALAANANRKGAIFINTSANWISLAFGVAAVLYSGITLAPNGGSFNMSEHDYSTQEIRAIASGAASNLAIQEFV